MSTMLIYRLVTPWIPNILAPNGPHGRETCVLTNSVGTLWCYIPFWGLLSLCCRVIPFCLREFPARIIHQTVPPRYGQLHENTPYCYVGRINKHMKIFRQLYYRAWDNITINAWYAFSSCFVHWKGTRCTTACNGVAKSAMYWSIRLCHWIWPTNHSMFLR